jgi:DNA-binding CsgD family transcriptional regulator
VLIGRDRERAELDRVLTRAESGRSAVLVLAGDAGIGKSILLDHTAAEAAARGFTVLRSRGIESEAELAFSGLHDVLGPVLELLPEIPERQAAVLASALALGPVVAADRFAVCAGTISVLGAAAERRPVLATIDDAHWLDRSSIDALFFAARRFEVERIALVFAVRTGSPSTLEASGLPELPIECLDEPSSRALLSDAWPEVDASAASRIVATAAGNPLALLEIPALLTDAQRRGRASLDEPLPAGASIERIFLKRLRGLPPETIGALLVAAASESGDLETITRAVGTSGDLGALLPAERSGLVRVTAAGVEFRHPLVRSAVYHGASAGERRDAHVALAAALAGRSEDRRAWHLAASAVQPDEQVAEALARAAARAGERSGYAAAASGQERAAALTPDPRRRADRLLDAARSLELCGSFDRAIGLLDAALAADNDPLRRADIQHVRGRIEAAHGNPTNAGDILVTAAEDVAARDPARASAMLIDAAMVEFATERREAALATGREALELGAGTATERRATTVLRALETTWSLPADGADATDLELALHGNELESPLMLATIATALAHDGEGDRARRVTKRYVERARSLGAIGALPQALVTLAGLEQHLSAAYACAAEARDLSAETGQLFSLANSLLCLGWVDGLQGREQNARAHLERAKTIMQRTGWGDDILVDYALARMCLVIGRPEETVRLMEPAVFNECGQVRHRSGWAVDLVEAYVRTGRLGDARSTLAQMEQRSWPEGTYRLGVEACRGLVATEDEFEQEFVTALTANEKSRGFFRARAELWFGQRLRRARRRGDARRWLWSALDGFETIGATACVEEARAELVATGEHVRRGRSTLADLTERELRVALVVADGATNKEAAAQLFLSPKTVEFHLGHVYRKLGVRSRTELARRLASTPR